MFFILITGLLSVSRLLAAGESGELLVGTASNRITPPLPVALLGQFHMRIAHTEESPLMVHVLALETRGKQITGDMAIFASCDLTVITPSLINRVRRLTGERIPGLDVNKIILTATHTHTAPVLGNENLRYPIPEGVTSLDSTLAFVSGQITDAIVRAWESRERGSVTWGLSQAAIGHNRRSVYADGSASMYGGTHVPSFRGMESGEDHDVNTLFFWNGQGKLLAMGINVACPAQEVENRSTVNADYWHEARRELNARFGDEVGIIAWNAASGDQSPRPMYRGAAVERMLRLAGKTPMEEMGRRIADAVEDAYRIVQHDRHAPVILEHKMDSLSLPFRMISEAEYIQAKAECERLAAEIAADPERAKDLYAPMHWFGDAARRYELQETEPQRFDAEIHVLRIGDVVICTNPFELFLNYGIQIQGRSKALQTFVVQLAGAGNYVPTEEAIRGGGYSVIMQSSFVGAEGGRMLVDRTVELIDDLWRPRQKAAQLELISPRTRIVFQRNSQNRGAVRVAGRAKKEVERVEARLVARVTGQGTTTGWTALPMEASGNTFSGRIEGPGGWYDLEVRSWQAGEITDVVRVERVGIGEVFLIVGHSVAQGGAINIDGAYDDRVNTVRLDEKEERFDQMYLTTGDPAYLPEPVFVHAGTGVAHAPFGHSNYFWSKFGEYVAQKENVPVLLFNAAFGGTSLEHWAKSSQGVQFEHGFVRSAIRMPYINVLNAFRKYIHLTGVRALLADQGANDAGQKDPDVIFQYYRTFLDQARKDLGYSRLALVVNRQSQTPAVRQAQERMIREKDCFPGPDYDLLSPADRYDGLHLSEAGLFHAARLWANALDPAFYRRSQPWIPSETP